ncbi:MAG TPA: ATP-binding protein [Candidatus Binatia bacterium]|nr:ATP-binding protein [Candidatus Binatia bacterium]
MKKSFIVLILVIQISALFIFENMHSLFRNLEKAETAAIIANTDMQAELHVLKTRLRLPLPGRPALFDQVVPVAAAVDSRQIQAAGRERVLLLNKRVDSTRSLHFRKTIRSPQLEALRALRKILSGLIIFLGIFIIACGIYLVLLLRKKGPLTVAENISPLQDYLLEIQKSELELKERVAAQDLSANKIAALNKSIINTIHLAVIFTDPTGKIEIFNPEAQKYFGRGFAAARNHSLADVLRDRPELLAFIEAARQKASEEIESAGRIFFTDVVPVGDSGRLVVIRDVSSDRKKERIRRVNANLMTLGEMAAALAHEIRNSLSVILGYSKAIRSEPEKTAKINNEIHFLSAMMESFLQFARPVAKINHGVVDLGPLITANAVAHGLSVALPKKDVRLQSDPLLLNVIFANLALNSSQAGAQRLKVETAAGENTTITIRDDGPGIAAAVRDKIWLPFFSTRDKGTGMGLATVKKLVTALNGDIQLLDDGQPGTAFRIVFYS